MEKRGFEFSFAWIFAIFVGAIIIFLAIYASVKAINVGKYKEESSAAKQLTIMFEPLETSLETGLKNKVELNQEAKVSNTCTETGDFGKQKFSFSIKSGFYKKWESSGGEISIQHKYVFSDKEEQGKKFYFFSKPFNMPFKVANLIFFSSKKYCFVDAPDFIENEVASLSLENIKIGTGSCQEGDIKVCFGGGSNCKIKVENGCIDSTCFEYEYGTVKKERETVEYAGSLIYAAIFSDPETYNCNVKRLSKRLRNELLIYQKEAEFLSGRFGAVPVSSLIGFIGLIDTEAPNLVLINMEAKKIDEQNSFAEIELW